MIVKSKRIYTDTGLKNGYLIIENGKFKGISETVDGDYIDYCDQRIIPGIFDTHNHGTLGYSLMGTGDDFLNEVHVRGYLKGCASQGITSVLPTTTSTDGMISTVVKISRENPIGAKIVGIHSEGPWLNRVGEKGIPTPWPEVSLDTAKKMVTDGEGMLRLVALAPEIDGIDPIIDYFRSEGITLAFAHSDCNYKEAMNAYNQKGLSVATHTGNVMTGMHHRDIGGLGASLVNDKVECELICDGMHISLEMIDIFFRIKDYSRFMMISDCTPFSGAPVGH